MPTPAEPFSIVVPALDEEQTIGAVLGRARPLTDDLIVVDGHSSDRTATIARQAKARLFADSGLGKGDALRVGLAAVRHPIVAFCDADGSHDPRDIPRLVAPIASGRADLVVGSRIRGGSDEACGSLYELIRTCGGLALTLAINLRFGVRLTDSQNGLRAIRTSVARALQLESNHTTIEQEMVMKCLAEGHRVLELPAHERRRGGGVSKVPILPLAHQYLWSLLRGLVRRSRGTRTQPRFTAMVRPSGKRPALAAWGKR